MSMLIVGGDSVETIKQQAQVRGHAGIAHWSGRKTRDVARPIPKGTEAVVVVLDRINHTLAREVRAEAVRRGIPVFFQRRNQQLVAANNSSHALPEWLSRMERVAV